MSEALMRLGWTPERETEFETHREDGLLPARVAVEHRSAYVLYGEQGELRAELAGRLRHEEIWPAVGDWVGVRQPGKVSYTGSQPSNISRSAGKSSSVPPSDR